MEPNILRHLFCQQKKHPDGKLVFYKAFFAKMDGSVLTGDHKNHHNIEEFNITFEDNPSSHCIGCSFIVSGSARKRPPTHCR